MRCNRSHRFSVRIALLGLVGLAVSPLEAKKRARPAPSKPVQIRHISLDIRNVFDPDVPGENIWPFRLANMIHIPTRESVIRRELLMREGAWTDPYRIEESERNLRSLPFIKEAHITRIETSDGRVDLRVRTQDSWTTQPQFNVASEGGQTSASGGFEEINLFGYGKDVLYLYKNNVDGTTHVVGYSDPQFLNTRGRLATLFQDTPSGNAQSLKLERPFYSLTTRTSAAISLDHSIGVNKIFQNGAEINRYDQEHLSGGPTFGLRVNNDPLNVVRMAVGYRYSEDVYYPQASTEEASVPAAKALSGPILSSTFLQSDFIKETFVDKTGRVEDTNLGHQVYTGVGYVTRATGATENSIPFAANDGFGFGGNDHWFGLASFGTSGRYRLATEGQTGGRLFNTVYFANFNYYRHLLEEFPMTGVFHAETAYLQNPDSNNVLSVGGNTGLRGYKVNSFTGNKSMLFNLENRFYFSQEFLHLAFMGGAVFMDMGQAQPEGLGFTAKDFHSNIGMGMRFGLSRSADGTVFRIDLAYAVGSVQQDSRWILSISSGQGFKREANTYANFPASSTQ